MLVMMVLLRNESFWNSGYKFHLKFHSLRVHCVCSPSLRRQYWWYWFRDDDMPPQCLSYIRCQFYFYFCYSHFFSRFIDYTFVFQVQLTVYFPSCRSLSAMKWRKLLCLNFLMIEIWFWSSAIHFSVFWTFFFQYNQLWAK